MTPDSPDWLEAWRLRIIATSISNELKERFGLQPLYSPDEVITACEARHVVGYARGCALAMFAEPEAIVHLLAEFHISDPAAEFRKILSRQLSYSDTSTISTPSTFSFHQVDSSPHHVFFGSHGDGGASGGFHGGGFDGGSGGHH